MSVLSEIVDAVERHEHFVDKQAERARTDLKFRHALFKHWNNVLKRVDTVTTPTGLRLPRVALPQIDDPVELARFLFGEAPPGQFPFVNGAYRELYLDRQKAGEPEPKGLEAVPEEPTRLFAGLGLAEDTNERFRYLTRQQKSVRLGTCVRWADAVWSGQRRRRSVRKSRRGWGCHRYGR